MPPRFAEGREGAAARIFRDGKLLVSIFHDERVDFEVDKNLATSERFEPRGCGKRLFQVR